MSVSVIIAARNSAATLGEQLDALLRQSPSVPWEVLVVDNASDDATAQIAAQYASAHSHFRCIAATERLGAGYARNTGVTHARYDGLLFCDADDVVSDGWVQAMAEGLARSSFVTGPLDVDRLNDEATIAARGRWVAQQSLTVFDGIFPYASSCNMGVSRDAFANVGGFDEDFLIGQDMELSLRLWLGGAELVWLPEALVHYRYRAGTRDIWRQGRRFGAVHPSIHARLRREGHSDRTGVRWRNAVWLIRKIGLLATASGRGRWLWTAGTFLGQLEGFVRTRVAATSGRRSG